MYQARRQGGRERKRERKREKECLMIMYSYRFKQPLWSRALTWVFYIKNAQVFFCPFTVGYSKKNKKIKKKWKKSCAELSFYRNNIMPQAKLQVAPSTLFRATVDVQRKPRKRISVYIDVFYFFHPMRIFISPSFAFGTPAPYLRKKMARHALSLSLSPSLSSPYEKYIFLNKFVLVSWMQFKILSQL